jgi:hypothetical protein
MAELLPSIVSLWETQIENAKKTKYRQFGKKAARLWDFLGKEYKDLYIPERSQGDEDEEFPHVKGAFYKPRLNKSAEYVALYVPYLHAKVPHRLVTPDRPQLPQDLLQLMQNAVQEQGEQQMRDKLRAWLMQWWINWTPGEFGLTREMRLMLPEALVKGRGILWHEMVQGPHGEIPASLYGSVDELLIDPDCVMLREAGWIVRQLRRSVWRLAEESGVSAEKLRGAYSSNLKRALDVQHAAGGDEKHDVVTYYEVWSRAGLGRKFFEADEEIARLDGVVERLGGNVWLQIVPGLSHPLNLPPELLESPESESMIKAALEWPAPFYRHAQDPWPFSSLDFYPNEDDPWSRSGIAAALPLQIFLDNSYAYLQGRIRATCRDLIITSSQLEEAVRTAIASGLDQELVVTDQEAAVVKDLIHIMQFPEVNKDLYQIIAMGERAYEKNTGMDPLLYGSIGETQARSAREMDVREGHVSSRPQDFADMTESFMSTIARKEGMMTRLNVGQDEVAPLFGEPIPQEGGVDEEGEVVEPVLMGPLTEAWQSLVFTEDEAQAAAELSYSIEAGSGRRKNKQKQMADAQALAQTLMQTSLQLYTQLGNPVPWNWVMETIGDAWDVDASKAMLQPFKPPEPEKKAASK